jgi:luciferase family oxidoreductase group 1
VRALRRSPASAETFPQDVIELQTLLGPPQPGQTVLAIPGAGLEVPLWMLGSSLFGAQLAAMLGLPYAFASHFAPGALMQALEVYRARFEPSKQLDRPYAMVAANVVVADSDAEERRLFTSIQQQFANLVRDARSRLPEPIEDIETYWSPLERAEAERMLACSFVGSQQTVREGLDDFISRTKADEVIVASAVFDHTARLRSYELLAELVAESAQTDARA